MRIHDLLAAAQLFIIARRRVAESQGDEGASGLWHHVREHIVFINETGQVYRFEDYLKGLAPTAHPRVGTAFGTREDSVSRGAMALLLKTLDETADLEEKQLALVLINLLNYVADSGQYDALEGYLEKLRSGSPPPVTASFATRDEAEEWLRSLPEPPSRAHVLIGDEYHEAWYSREDGARGLAREYVLEPILEDSSKRGLPPTVASFNTRDEAEAWLAKHPASPLAVVSIAGEQHLAVNHAELNRHSLHSIIPSLKEWEEEKRRAAQRQKELDEARETESPPGAGS